MIRLSENSLLIAFFLYTKSTRRDIIFKHVVIKQTSNKDKRTGEASDITNEVVIITKTRHEAYLQLLMEAEPLYEHHDEIEGSDTHKVFLSHDQSVRTELVIQQAPELNTNDK